LYYTDKLYASLSTVNILETEHYDGNSTVSTASDNMVMYLSAGYVVAIGNDFKLKPSFLMRAVNGSPLSTDISASILWNNRLEFGIAHRIDESISGMFQVRVSDTIKVGYSYDTITNNLNNYNNGSHEISLAFDLGVNGKHAAKKRTPLFW